MRIFLVGSLTVAALVAGCASPADIREADTRQCNGYGYTPGTDAHAGCMQKIASDRQKNMQAFMNPGAAAAPAATTTECRDNERSRSTTNGTSTSTTTGVPGNSTTTGSSSSTTSSSSSGFSLCVNK